MYAHICLIRSYAATLYGELNVDAHNLVFDIGYCLIYFLFGLLADVKVGRYTSIITGLYLSFSSWIIAGLAFIIMTYFITL